jgi:Carboxypeptidase regulatory-like domain
MAFAAEYCLTSWCRLRQTLGLFAQGGNMFKSIGVVLLTAFAGAHATNQSIDDARALHRQTQLYIERQTQKIPKLDEADWISYQRQSDTEAKQIAQAAKDLSDQLELLERGQTSTKIKLSQTLHWVEIVQRELKAQMEIRIDKNGPPVRNVALMGAAYDSLLPVESGSCENAIELRDDSAFAVTLKANQPQWFTVVTHDRKEVLLKTVGSEVDTQLAIYSACPGSDSDLPIAKHDDGLGLFAEYTAKRTPRPVRYYIKLSSELSGRAQIKSALVGESISGRVTLPLGVNSFVYVEVYTRSGNNFSYAGQASVNGGSYQLLIDPGTYYVFTRSSPSETLLNQIYNGIPCYRSGSFGNIYCNANLATPVTVNLNVNTSGIDFSLTRGATIQGRVLGLASQDSGSARLSTRDGIEIGTSFGALGRFRFQNLPPGTYYMGVSGNSFQPQIYSGINCSSNCSLSQGTPIVLAPEQILGEIEFSPALSGRIAGSLQTAIPNQQGSLLAYSEQGNFAGNTFSTGGSYSLPLAAGRYRLIFSASGHITQVYNGISCTSTNFGSVCDNLSSGALVEVLNGQVTAVNASLALSPSLLGTVRDESGVAILNSSVSLCRSTGSFCERQTQTNNSGEFVFSDLQPGRYRLLAASDQYIDEVYPDVVCQSPLNQVCNPNLTGGQIIDISTGTTSGINFTLSRAGSISGAVSGSPADGAIQAYKEGVTSGTYRSVSVWNSGGTYRIDDLESGRYRLLYEAGSNTFSQVFSRINCTSCDIQAGMPIEVVQGQNVPDRNFVLSSRRQISGRVTDAVTGAPLPGVAIDVWSYQTPPLLPTPQGSTSTNQNGQFVTDGLFQFSPNGYYLSTDAPSTHIDKIHSAVECAAATSAYAGSCSFNGATLLAIPANFPGTLDNIDFELRSVRPFFESFSNGFED